ncbi:thioredoxin domain-containing protein [Pantoea sp. KPR_PJ]
MTSPENSAESRMFTPEQEARIGQIAKAYLLAHPEVLMEAGEKLDALQHEKQIERITAAVIEHQDALLNDKAIPTAGPAEAKVAVIEFFDYQCIVCARQAPIVNSLMQAHPEVRYIFMEWPIFASRWETSLTAAETGLMVWQQKGAEAYLAYHHALFATGHQEGKLTQADIKKAAGKLKGKAQTMLDVIARTDALAQNLGFMGTPGIIVMPATGAGAHNVTVFPGGVNQPALEAAITKAAGTGS